MFFIKHAEYIKDKTENRYWSLLCQDQNTKTFLSTSYRVQCNRESRRVSCLIVNTNKMNQIIAKQAQNKKDPVDVFLISLHFAEVLATVKNNFEEQFDQQLKHRITEFADVTEEPQGLPPHRGHLDHKMKLTIYQPRKLMNRLSVHEYLKRQSTEIFKEGKVQMSSRKVLMPLQSLLIESHMVQSEFVLIFVRLMSTL